VPKRLVVRGWVALGLAGLAMWSAPGGSGASPGERVLDVYSSMPLQGPAKAQAVAIVNGIKLALKQAGGSAGPWAINYISLDDSTAAAGKWDPARCAANARRAAADPNAVYYVGAFNSGCSEVSIPILNQANVPQVSPDNTYVGLTTHDPGSAPGEPSKYYPSGKRTYLRISARDTVQAAALLTTMHRDGCRRVAIANDQEAYGDGLAALMGSLKHRYGVRIISSIGIDPTARSYGAYARSLQAHHVDCFMFAGITASNAVLVTEDVAAAIPRAKLYGGDGICLNAFTDPAAHGIPSSIGRRFKCTVLNLPLNAYPGGPAFLSAYKAEYRVSNPDPYAVYGYEAMKLGLNTIASLGSNANSRPAILTALLATKDRHSVIGTYSFDRNGDTTLRSYGLYKVKGRRGTLVFVRNVSPR
jgi:branched-chain amino acid transport system substrate-binding protein